MSFFQTGVVSRTGIKDSTEYGLPSSASQGIDFGIPYGGVAFSTNDIVPEFGDGPDDTFGHQIDPIGSVILDQLGISDSYETWIMFQSSRGGSCWIPLKHTEWSWGAVAPITHPAGVINNIGQGDHNGSSTTDFPLWNSAINAKEVWTYAQP